MPSVMHSANVPPLSSIPRSTPSDHHVFAHGDGCLQEGVAKEAIAFAGHNQLDNLILIYDSNDVTLDAMAERTQSEDVESYFASQAWDAVTIDGHDPSGHRAVARKRNDNGKPKVITQPLLARHP